MPGSVLEAPLLPQVDESNCHANGSICTATIEGKPAKSCVSCSKNLAKEESWESDDDEAPFSSRISTVAKLAASFFFVYSAMDALSEYVTSLLPSGLGDESLFLLQAALCASTLAAPTIVSSVGELRSMMLGGAAHVIYLASLVKPCRYVILSSSAFCGFGASLTWVAQGTFLTKCSPPSKRGLYTGVFWGIYYLSSIVGNLAAFLIFKYLSQAAMFGIGSLSATIGVLLLLLVEESKTDLEVTTGNNDLEILHEKSCQEFDSSNDLLAFRKKSGRWKTVFLFLLLLPITFYLGCQTAFWTGEFTKLLPAGAIGIVLLFTGLGQVVGSFFLSWLSDFLCCGTPTFLLGALASAAGLIICIPLHNHRSSSTHEVDGILGTALFGAPVLAYIVGLLFGIADGVLTSHVFAITGRIFQGRKPQIWALFNLLGTAGAAATFWIGITFPMSRPAAISVQVWIQLTILSVGGPLYIIVDVWSARFAKSSAYLEPLLNRVAIEEPVAVIPVAS